MRPLRSVSRGPVSIVRTHTRTLRPLIWVLAPYASRLTLDADVYVILRQLGLAAVFIRLGKGVEGLEVIDLHGLKIALAWAILMTPFAATERSNLHSKSHVAHDAPS